MLIAMVIAGLLCVSGIFAILPLLKSRRYRDRDCLYQRGIPVGRVAGEVLDNGTNVVFGRLVNTGQLDTSDSIEYRGHILRICGPVAREAMRAIFNGDEVTVLVDIMENVTCIVIK